MNEIRVSRTEPAKVIGINTLKIINRVSVLMLVLGLERWLIS